MTSMTIHFPEGTKATDVSPINKAIAEVARTLGLKLESRGRINDAGIEFSLVPNEVPAPACSNVVQLPVRPRSANPHFNGPQSAA